MPYVYFSSDEDAKESRFQERINNRRQSKNKSNKPARAGGIVKKSSKPQSELSNVKFSKQALRDEAAELFDLYNQVTDLDLNEIKSDSDFLAFLVDAVQGLIDRMEVIRELAEGKRHRELREALTEHINATADLLDEISIHLQLSYDNDVSISDSESDSESDSNIEDVELIEDNSDVSSTSSSSDSDSESSDSESESDSDADSEDNELEIDINDESLDSDDVAEFLANIEEEESSSSSSSEDESNDRYELATIGLDNDTSDGTSDDTSSGTSDGTSDGTSSGTSSGTSDSESESDSDNNIIIDEEITSESSQSEDSEVDSDDDIIIIDDTANDYSASSDSQNESESDSDIYY